MKYFKPNERFECKLKLPADLPWKLLAALVKDLGVGDPTSDNYVPDIIGIIPAIRSRDVERLMGIQSELSPRRIAELSGGYAQNFYAYYQLAAFLKKYPFPGYDTKAAAIRTFKDAERKCFLYNSENYKSLLALSELHPDYRGVVEELREDILSLIGERPNLESIYGNATHGPGVSLGPMYQDGKATSYYKWSNLPYSVTESTLPYAIAALESDQRWSGALYDWYRRKTGVQPWAPICVEDFYKTVFNVVPGSKITTVAKTALTDRTIAIEPVMNVFLQLGVNSVLRARLKKRWHYDLFDQLLNQQLAEEASRDGSLATVDLKSASDLISLKICELLLPVEWYSFLCDLRCSKGQLDGETIQFEKMSSMGNGYTFALESVIFGALARCAIRRTSSRRRSAVYGDDIIVPVTAYSFLVDLIQLCGFAVNEDKSYSTGLFRESCGADFYAGHNVRPFFLKRQLKTVQDLFYVHNSFFARKNNVPWYWDYTFHNILNLLRKYIPVAVRKQFHGPPSESYDTYLFSDRKLKKRQGGRYEYYTVQPVAKLYNKGTQFFFRKLMAELKPKPPLARWDKERVFNTGNVFDATRRGRLRYKCRKGILFA